MFVGCLAVAGAGALAGCQDTPGPKFSEDWQHLPEPVGPGLVSDPKAPLGDLPKPIGFALIERDSSIRHTNNGRLVLQKYQGRSTIGETLSFYQQHLPLTGWEAAPTERSDTQAVIEGRKGNEALEIILRQEGRVTSILARISPISITTTSPTPAPGYWRTEKGD